jgi:mannose-6-phosphate isomerase
MPLLAHRDHEDRPWGSFDQFTLNESSTVKVISVEPNQRLSLQTHSKRDEFWYILSGQGEVTVGDTVRPAKAGDEFEIPVGTAHRASGGTEGLTFLEVSLGEFDEHDEVRLEDSYGRTSPTSQ